MHMSVWEIDLNCDVGEGIGNEAELFPHISSCNIACGGHVGDLNSMRIIARLAKQHGIKIGAHPSYPDKVNFGREVMEISDSELMESIRGQLSDFEMILGEEECTLHHIKAHGALYNEIAKNAPLAEVYLESIKKYKENTILYVPYGSVVSAKAQKMGFSVWFEAFADRNYTKELQLVSRKKEKALILHPEKVLNHVLPMIKKDLVRAITGELLKIKAQTLCVHGDTDSALEILMYLSKELPNHQVRLRK